MATEDVFRARLDPMIDLRSPLWVLGIHTPSINVEDLFAPALAHRDCAGSGERGAGSGERGAASGERRAASGERGAGCGVQGADTLGPTVTVAGVGANHADRTRTPICVIFA